MVGTDPENPPLGMRRDVWQAKRWISRPRLAPDLDASAPQATKGLTDCHT
jgi:hypothetical protein